MWWRAARTTSLPYRCWTSGPVPLSRLIAVAVARWRIEEDHQLAKQSTGLDAGQVIGWRSWHRWTTLCLLAYIYPAVAIALQRQQDTSSELGAGLIPITVPELLRLPRDTVIPPPRQDPAHRMRCTAAVSTGAWRWLRPAGGMRLTRRSTLRFPVVSLGRMTFEGLDAVKYGRADQRHTTADVPRLRP
jgi:hypothetical protein